MKWTSLIQMGLVTLNLQCLIDHLITSERKPMIVNLPVEALWTVYGIGVVLFPIIVGFLFKGKKFDVMDDGVPMFFCSLFWPIVVLLLVVIGCVMVVCFISGGIWTGLLRLGSGIGLRYGQWRRSRNMKRREREEREHAKRVLNAKLGYDKEYFDYVCD